MNLCKPSYFVKKFMENKQKCSGCGCKVSIVVSVLALIVASAAYFCPKKSSSVTENATFDEKVRGIIVDTVKQNPQLVMNAMGEGIAKQREDELKKIEQAVSDKSADITKLAMKFGKLESKASVICFIDPLEKACVEIQKQMLNMVKAKKDLCFKVLPVAVLGNDSVTLAKVYLAVYEKSAEKAIKFIEHVTSSKGDMDKKAIEASLKAAGLDNKEIEGMMDDCDKKLAENGQLADSMKLPLVPAIFTLKDGKATMLRLASAEQLLPAIEAATK